MGYLRKEKKIFSSPNIISGVLRGDGTLPLADWHPFFFFVKKVITHSILGGNGGGTIQKYHQYGLTQ